MIHKDLQAKYLLAKAFSCDNNCFGNIRRNSFTSHLSQQGLYISTCN